MNFDLKNKRAVVCGASDGIGKACAQLLAQNGADITIVARNEHKINSVIKELDSSKNQHHKYICSDFNHPEKLQKELDKDFKDKVDILINNSGGPHGGQLIESEIDEFRVAFERLLVSNQIMTKAVVPNMKKQKYGRIINIISTSIKQVIPGLGVSNTIRGAVAQWAKTLALELGEFNITVNNILPGYTSTERLNELANMKSKSLNISKEEIKNTWAESTALNRLANPIEIANAALFLASDESSYITGHNLAVDGGRFKA
ncbi:MAG: SDR family oxidoreductase [Candidatus Neomarinimicrobiota bacterium]|nr:SDR family oxidoreductase [Candidatus Neomarinimicrobiota bacterium]